MELIEIPIIVLICYLVGEIYKKTFEEKYYKYIPIIVSLIGVLLSILIYYNCPEIMNKNYNLIEAIAIGLVSGLASTGTNQVLKQILKSEK